MSIKKTFSKEVLITLSFILLGCDQEFVATQRSYPLIETIPVTDIDKNGAQFNAQLVKIGTDAILDYGFKYAEKPTKSGYLTGRDTISISVGSELKGDFSAKVNQNLSAGVTYNVMAYAVTTKYTVIGHPVVFKSISTSPSAITSFSANNVLDGDIITIFGENFNWFDANVVSFGDQPAEVLSSTYKSITVAVPPIPQAGHVEVRVDTYSSVATSDQLNVISPSITAFSPMQGSAGDVFLLNGRFSSTLSYNKVYFNGVSASIYSSETNKILGWVPAGVSGNVSITINVNGKTSVAANTFLVN